MRENQWHAISPAHRRDGSRVAHRGNGWDNGCEKGGWAPGNVGFFLDNHASRAIMALFPILVPGPRKTRMFIG
jgi:hypothetical protein